MDLVICRGRGKGLEDALYSLPENPIINPHFIVRPVPKTLILNLTREAKNIIAHSSTPNSLIHVYFIAGLIAITEKNQRSHLWRSHFQWIIRISPISCHVMSLIHQSSKSISKTGATPCYATITPMHMNTWNEHRLNIQCTSYLLHHNHYDSMQTNLIKTVTEINSLITELNISNYIQTPRLAQHTLYKPGQRRPTYKFRHHLLADGIHVRHIKNYMGQNINRYYGPEQIPILTTKPHSSFINLAPHHLLFLYCFVKKNPKNIM